MRPKGIKVKDIVEGSGAVAEKGKVVVVQCDCRLNRGDLVFSSRNNESPYQFKIGERYTYLGIEQCVVGMRVGGKREVKVGPNLTYDERDRFPNLPLGAMLRYEIDLLSVREDWDNSLYSKDRNPSTAT